MTEMEIIPVGLDVGVPVGTGVGVSVGVLVGWAVGIALGVVVGQAGNNNHVQLVTQSVSNHHRNVRRL